MVLIVVNAAMFIFYDRDFSDPPKSDLLFVVSLAIIAPVLALMLTLSGMGLFHSLRYKRHPFTIPEPEAWLFFIVGAAGGWGAIRSVISLLDR
jgi:hypothetical protein